MAGHYLRADMLFRQGRYQEAEKELKSELAQNPTNHHALALLSSCYSERDEFDKALTTIKQALSISPSQTYFYRILANIYQKTDDLDQADKTILRAIELDPNSADNFLVKSHIEYRKKNWTKSLEFADKGLNIDAEHLGCINMRNMALVMLNRKDEAEETIRFALNKNPEDSLSHANVGWTALNRSQINKATESFKEALRLDPDNEYAREGLKQAIKAKFPPYRAILAYFLWMAKMSQKGQWGFIIGFYVIYRIMLTVARNSPAIAPFIYPFIFLYVLFAFSTWIAVPASNLFLRFHKLGKHALTKDEKFGSNIFIVFLVAAISFLVAYFTTKSDFYLFFAAFSALMMLPVGATFSSTPKSKERKIKTIYTSVLFVIGILAIFLPTLNFLSIVFILGIFFFGWVSNYLTINRS